MTTLVVASMYGDPADIRRTNERHVATGARFDPTKMAAAHRTLPFGTHLTLRRGHWSAVVVINDRGPFIRGRTFDLTPAANKALRCYGMCRVKVEHWPPLPKPRPDIPIQSFAWGEE